MPIENVTSRTNKKEAVMFPLTILEFDFSGLITLRNNPELILADNEPEMFPRISKNPGRRINIPGINSNLSMYNAIRVPTNNPEIIEIN